MSEKNPIKKVQEFLNSTPTDSQRNIILSLCIAASTACPFFYVAYKLLVK